MTPTATSAQSSTPALTISTVTHGTGVLRKEVPKIRKVKRGTVAEAILALASDGQAALVDALLADRFARSETATRQCLINTWHRFHDEAFGHATPTIPVLPITVRGLVNIGALFKGGGYRSYPNYVSAMRREHIEAGHDWDQLI